MINIIMFVGGAIISFCITDYLLQRKLKQKVLLDEETQRKNYENAQLAIELKDDITKLNNSKSLILNDIAIYTNQRNDLIENVTSMREHVDNDIEEYRKKSLEVAELNLDQSFEKLSKEFQESKEKLEQEYAALREETNKEFTESFSKRQEELKEIQDKIATLKAEYQAAIAARVRENEIKEQMDFYCLHTEEIDKNDIAVLNRMKAQLAKPRILSMLIWSTYYQKPMGTLCNNVLGTETITGIYKITNQQTGECYIGQSTDISRRWKDHAKCGLGIDTPVGNKLYKAMQECGLEAFSWELLEKCSSKDLNAKEKYYIELYDSANFGYNSTIGNK